MARRVAIQPAAEALAGWVAGSARNQQAVEAMGADALGEAMAGLLLGAQEVGKGGTADRAMLIRMMGQPWASGSAQQQGGKVAAVDMGNRLASALNRMERRLGGPAEGGAIIEVEADSPETVTPEAAVAVDLGF